MFPQLRSEKRNLTLIDIHLRDEMSDMWEYSQIKIPGEIKFLSPILKAAELHGDQLNIDLTVSIRVNERP
jgi:hypothetical protein